uniref:Uncharacterized protein n=1 Tax=Solanum lycopersicum TaxID=4081 RepID=A0A3Q7I101_SOLLC
MIAANCVPPVRLINRVLKMIGRVDRHFNIELLKESPSPAIRTCTTLAQLQVLLVAGHNLVRLVRSLEMTLSSSNIPPEILATLLNLDGDAEYSLLVNLKRLNDVQLSRRISIEILHNDLTQTASKA